MFRLSKGLHKERVCCMHGHTHYIYMYTNKINKYINLQFTYIYISLLYR